jgi:hypothetical protein
LNCITSMDTLHCASMYFVDCVVLPSIRILASFLSILDELALNSLSLSKSSVRHRISGFWCYLFDINYILTQLPGLPVSCIPGPCLTTPRQLVPACLPEPLSPHCGDDVISILPAIEPKHCSCSCDELLLWLRGSACGECNHPPVC